MIKIAVGISVALLLGGVLVARSAPDTEVPPADPPFALLLPDPRLDRAVKCSQRNGSTSHYAATISEACSVPLTVHPDLQETRLTVLNGESTPRKLLQGMEWVSNATWVAPKGKDPCHFEQTKRDWNRLQAARAKHEREGRIRLQRRWDQVRQWSDADPDQLRELAKHDPGMAHVLGNQRSSAMHKLGFHLPNSVYSTLWTKGVVRIPINSLPPDLQSLVLASSSQESNFPKQELLSQGMLKLEVAGPADRPTVWISAKTKTQGYDGNLLYAEGWTREPPVNRRAAIEANPTPVPPDAVFRKRVTVVDPASRLKSEVDERPMEALPLLPLVEQIAHQTGVPTIVQCDFRPRPDEPKEQRNARVDHYWLLGQWWLADDIRDQPLAHALDLVCADFEYEWTFRKGVLLLRHQRWYLPEDERDRGRPLQPVFPK